MSKLRIISRETSVNKPIDEVFAFFAKAENLNIITPPELKFKITTPLPIDMKKGTLIDYKIKLNGIPFKWKTEITDWSPPYRFVDTQLKGPYRVWIHEHIFGSKGNNTFVKDIVSYLPPGRVLEPVIHKLAVKKKLEHIFDYRMEKIKSIFK
ncbi:MAG TPA: SRPBCC family protein [Ignavibacteria bacterium]|nr:SRPBCC family protein [Ignavibacteria bacterium]HMQ98461.1 SRPBCC family protein [Ignavibacteria bacterium]